MHRKILFLLPIPLSAIVVTTAPKPILICIMPISHHPFLMHIFSPYMQRLQAAKYKWTILKSDIHFSYSKIQNILSSVPMETERIF